MGFWQSRFHNCTPWRNPTLTFPNHGKNSYVCKLTSAGRLRFGLLLPVFNPFVLLLGVLDERDVLVVAHLNLHGAVVGDKVGRDSLRNHLVHHAAISSDLRKSYWAEAK
jgi:hypothetical protein